MSSMKDKFSLVGTKIKEFNLPNSRGETKSIGDFLGQNVVIILFRSKSWPYAKAHAKKLSDNFEKLQDFNAKLYAILPDNAENAKSFNLVLQKNFQFIMIPKKK